MNLNELNIDASTRINVQSWLDGAYDDATKQAIHEMMNNPEELNESFYRNLEFGTGGLRGIMGVGTNRMNKYTVAMATQGLANYVKKCFADQNCQLKAAISHDSRNHSREFAEITARSTMPPKLRTSTIDVGVRPYAISLRFHRPIIPHRTAASRIFA